MVDAAEPDNDGNEGLALPLLIYAIIELVPIP